MGGCSMANDAIYFQRGTPLRVWMQSQASVRWAPEEEVRRLYGMSRDEWLRRWREEKAPRPRRAA